MDSVTSEITNFNVGDFCCIVKESEPIECVIHSIKNDFAVIISIGFNKKHKVPMKDLCPSSGSNIRLEQEFKAVPIERLLFI